MQKTNKEQQISGKQILKSSWWHTIHGVAQFLINAYDVWLWFYDVSHKLSEMHVNCVHYATIIYRLIAFSLRLSYHHFKFARNACH